MGGSGAHPARCWAQTNPGHARRGPLGARPTSPPCRGRAGYCSSPPGPSEGPASQEKGDGHQKGGRNSGWDSERRCRSRYHHTGDAHHTKHTRAHSGRVTEPWPQELAAGRVSDHAGLSVTRRSWFAAPFSLRRWATPAFFFFFFFFKPITDLVTGRVKAMEVKRNTFAYPLG